MALSESVLFYDRSNIDELIWPQTEEAHYVRTLFLPMILDGVQGYIGNVETQLFLLKIGDRLIPCTVNDKEYKNSYLVSNYFIINSWLENLSKKKTLFSTLQKPFVYFLGEILKRAQINKTIIINNWLLTANIYPDFEPQDLQKITECVTKRFVGHTLIFRTLTEQYGQITEHLQNLDYHMIEARSVFIYDPQKKEKLPSKALYHRRRDSRLLDKSGYTVVRGHELTQDQLDMVLALYSHTYTSYTHYSPAYTKKFLATAVREKFLHLVCLEKEGNIHGMFGYHERLGKIVVPFFGFDGQKAAPNHLYRMLINLIITESEIKNITLNDGSGGEKPKRVRGMVPITEYVAVYDRHLPVFRRLFWGLSAKSMQWMKAFKQ